MNDARFTDLDDAQPWSNHQSMGCSDTAGRVL